MTSFDLNRQDLRLAIDKVRAGESLGEQWMQSFVTHLVDNPPTENNALESDYGSRTRDLLAAIHQRGNRKSELVGACRVIRERSVSVAEADDDMVDTCGTGGDGAGTFNISTTAAIIVAGAGVKVAKHGNRAATSKCGSADVLEALGVNIDLNPAQSVEVLEQAGISFFYARECHPVMATVANLRKSIPHPTIFNLIGPLCHPMRVKHQLIGTPSPALSQLMGEAAIDLGAKVVWTVASADGLDELSTAATATLYQYTRDRSQESASASPQSSAVQFATTDIKPGALVPPSTLDQLQGGDAQTNAAIIRDILGGNPSPKRDIAVLNAAAAIALSPKATSLDEGLALANDSIDTGAAKAVLDAWIRQSNTL